MKRVILVAVLAVGGCATSYPLRMSLSETEEVFVGTARSSFDSTFDMTNAAGLTCSGTYEAPMVLDLREAVTVKGIINCPDGRTGQWTVSGNGRGGQGVGMLGGKTMRVYFGNFVVDQQIKSS